MSKHPEILWAQRSSATEAAKNIVYLTVNLPDIVESSLKYDLTATKLTLEATAGGYISFCCTPQSIPYICD
ncbi:hypothetical protein HYDPIDRAFT_107060 [Hydnomerulius pinastri MD-312]|nr:hypothetical protein HYDPIDRAFT_107060 [Hydnomerulius pinastri MD-312]